MHKIDKVCIYISGLIAVHTAMCEHIFALSGCEDHWVRYDNFVCINFHNLFSEPIDDMFNIKFDL